MKSVLLRIAFLCALLPAAGVHAQVMVNGATNYASLTLAFTAINNGLHTGNITVRIDASIAETASPTLNASGVGSASYSRITIVPNTTGGPFTISRSINGAFIALVGCDNVVIDGNVGGNRHLIFQNSSTGNNAANSVIRLTDGATNDTIRNCIIEGGSTSGTAGLLFIGNDAVTANGNHTLQVRNCLFRRSVATGPNCLLRSRGTSATVQNHNIEITGCYFDDWNWVNSGAVALHATTGNASWRITDNHFYSTTSRNRGAGGGNSINYGLQVASANSGGSWIITGNKFGGSGRDASNNITGTFDIVAPGAPGVNMRYRAMEVNMNQTVATDSVLVANNELGNHRLRAPSASGPTQQYYMMLCGGNSRFMVRDNLIRDFTVVNSGNTTFGNDLYGMAFGGSNANNVVRNNTFRNLEIDTLAGSGTMVGRIYALRMTNVNGACLITGNTFTGFVNRSIATSATTAGPSQTYAIYNGAVLTVANSFTYNRIENITDQAVQLYGIYEAGTGTGVSTYTGNRIQNLSSSSPQADVQVTGFASVNARSLVVSTDTIRQISATGTGSQLRVFGMRLSGSGTDSIVSCLIEQITATASLNLGPLPTVNGVFINNTGNIYFGQTTIANISASAAADIPSRATGIHYAGTGTGAHRITRNRIYGIRNTRSVALAPTTAPAASGIYVTDASTDAVFSNNMIAVGYGATEQAVMAGIWLGSNYTADNLPSFVYNSVAVGGSTLSLMPSYAFLRGDLGGGSVTARFRLLNNLLHNTRTGPLPLHFAVANLTTATGWTNGDLCGPTQPNHNALYANTSAELGFWMATPATDMANWRTLSGTDQFSVDLLNNTPSTPIAFTNAPTADLHVPSTDLRLNAKGIPLHTIPAIDVTGDFDGPIFRQGPDIGADEVRNIDTFTAASGFWHDPLTWNGGSGVPTHADSVFIPTGAVVTVASGNPGVFYELEIASGGQLVLQNGAYLEGAWNYDGLDFFGQLHNNGTITANSGTIALAGRFINNGTYTSSQAGTVQLNLDTPTQPVPCVQTWIATYNDDAATSQISGSTNTVFHNLTLLNACEATDATPTGITLGSAALGTGTLGISPNGWLRWDGRTLTLAGTVDGTGTLWGSATSNLAITGTGDMAAAMTVGLLNFHSSGQLLSNVTLNRTSGLATLGANEAGNPVSLTIQGHLAGTLGELAIGLDNTLRLSGTALCTGGSLTGSDVHNTHLRLEGAANDHLGTLRFTQTTAGTHTLHSLYMGRGNSDAAYATLGTSVRVRSLFTLASGRVVTGAHEVYVTTDAPTAVDQQQPYAFVQGYLRRQITGDNPYLFPLGVAGQPGRAELHAHTLASVNNLLGTYLGGDPGTAGWDPDPLVEDDFLYDCTSSGGYWDFSPYQNTTLQQPTGGTYDLTLEGYGTDCPDATRFTIGKRPSGGGPWTFGGSTAGTYGTSPSRRNGYASFSEFAIIGAEEVPLPVEGLQFAGTLQGRDALLQWQSVAEPQLLGYTLEYAPAGQPHTALTFAPAQGDAQTGAAYGYRHQHLQNGYHSYRLRLVDLDGTTRHSASVLLLLSDGGSQASMVLFPNPTAGSAQLATYGLQGPATLQVLNTLGQVVSVQAFAQLADGAAVALPALAPGTYVVQLQYSQGQLSQRLVVVE